VILTNSILGGQDETIHNRGYYRC